MLWSYKAGDTIYSSPAVANGVVYIGVDSSINRSLYALNATTGSALWNYQTANFWIYSSPAVANGVVYVGSNDYQGNALGNFYAWNASSGNLLWSYPTSGEVFSSPAVVNGVVYIGSENNIVYALNASNGGNLWSYKTAGSVSWSSPAVADGLVYVGSDGGDVYAIGSTGPTPTPTPTNTPTPQPTAPPSPTPAATSSPTPTPILPKPTIDLFCKSSTSYSNFRVEITGSLTFNGTILPGVPVLLSYSVNDGNSWIGLTTASTDNNGNFDAVWFPSASGNYLLNAEWTGNSTFSDANTTINFAVIPYLQDQTVFSVSSNSTISAFSFNSTNQELSFSVSGPQGSQGYVDLYIPKTLISDISTLKVYLDGNPLAYTDESQGDSWLISFTYHHSSHQVVMNLATNPSTPIIQSHVEESVIAGVAILIVAIATVALMLRKRKTSKRLSDIKTG